MQFTHTPSSLIAAAEQIRAAAVAVTEEVATTIRPEHATFQNAILPLAESENQRLHLQRTLTLYGAVHPSKELREAAGVVGAIFSNIEMDLQRDEIVSIFDHIRRREWESLDGESRRYLDRKTRAFLEAGLTIPKGPNRDRFQDIKRQIYLLGKTCRGNLSSPEHGLWLTLQELDGVSGDVLEALEACHTEKNAVMVWVTFKTPILEAVMRSAKRSSTRRLVYTYNENRCLENAPLQKEIFGLRDEAARLLGYPSRAAFKIEAKLAKTPENVYQFLREFQNWEKANAESEKRNMIAMKKAFLIQHPQESWDDPDRLFLWDMSFYRRLLLRTDEVGEDERVEHFPLGPTLNSILAKLGSFFGMEFLQVTSDGYKSALAGPGKEHTLLWCDDATMFTVWDDESAGGEFLGYLYFDLHPREYKTDHKVTISVQMVCRKEDIWIVC
jgi:metallopeptidase MepB